MTSVHMWRRLPACGTIRLVLPLLILLLTLCSLASADDLSEMGPRSNLQVVLWETGSPGAKAALQELVFSFQRANPDVIVCLEWKDVQLQDDWTRRWAGAQRQYAPDITVMTERRAYEDRHELLELPDEFGRELRRDYARPVMRRLPGAARGVPWAVSTYALYYRADLLAEAEQPIPATPDALVEVAEALADAPNHYGLGLPRPMAGGERMLHALA
ncbi:MAG: extracellular solute-binding protein, partial [Armatimonadia bacterium]|nr:extracellular solute-binding protein [Armatimonadia bacterium]